MLMLEKLLQGLDITVEPFALCRVGGGQRLALSKAVTATLHYVVAGRGTLSIEQGPLVELCAGTMVIVPAGRRQELIGAATSDPTLAATALCQPLNMGLQALEAAPDPDAGVAMTCGAFKATYQQLHGIFDYLPAPIIEQAQVHEPLRSAFDALLREMASPQPGSAVMLRVLMRQCLILVLRKYCASGHCQLPWLTALQDPRLGKIIAEIVEQPGRAYTLELLADRAHMSRSTFAERFAKTFGRPAMDFVREVRLRQAAKRLIETDQPVQLIAAQLGYDSRSHFSRAFHAFFGMTPAQHRATHRVNLHDPGSG